MDVIAAIKIKLPHLYSRDNLGLFQENDKPYYAVTPDEPNVRRWGE